MGDNIEEICQDICQAHYKSIHFKTLALFLLLDLI